MLHYGKIIIHTEDTPHSKLAIFLILVGCSSLVNIVVKELGHEYQSGSVNTVARLSHSKQTLAGGGGRRGEGRGKGSRSVADDFKARTSERATVVAS